MEINISGIVSAKLEQMDRDGIVQKKIEETLEKTVLDVIASEPNSYAFRKSISDQVSESISEIAKDCGFSSYNGFIAERVRAIIQDMYTDDISQKVQDALNNVMLKRHDNVKLSEIFQAYREWVLKIPRNPRSMNARGLPAGWMSERMAAISRIISARFRTVRWMIRMFVPVMTALILFLNSLFMEGKGKPPF